MNFVNLVLEEGSGCRLTVLLLEVGEGIAPAYRNLGRTLSQADRLTISHPGTTYLQKSRRQGRFLMAILSEEKNS